MLARSCHVEARDAAGGLPPDEGRVFHALAMEALGNRTLSMRRRYSIPVVTAL